VKNIRGKKALITGAASGIGRAIVLALAREGADLFLVDIDEPNLQAVAHEVKNLGSRTIMAVCDLSQPDQVTKTIKTCMAAFDGLDILVNAAGIAQYGAAARATAEMWDAVMAVNLFAVIQLTRELLPWLIMQEESHILNVCSVAGLVPGRKMICYQTSKFALVGFSMALRTEFSAQNVGVTALCPGFVDTPMLAKMAPSWLRKSLSLGSFSLVISAEAVARAAIASIRRNRAIAVVSFSGRLMWWIYRLSPTLVLWLFRRRRR